MDSFALISTGIWSIIPPIVALVLALSTKEVYSSLAIGVLLGTFIYSFAVFGFTGAGFVNGITIAPQIMASRIAKNGTLILFLALLGSLVAVVTLAGGSRAYGIWASKAIKTSRSAKVCTALLGCLIFIDDYFNCLTVGTVMRPITDRYGVSREKLSYLIDATAAPVCIIAPISSWAVAVGSTLEGAGVQNGFAQFVASIPFNFYAILTIIMVFVVAATKLDFGSMRKAELAAAHSKEFARDAEELTYDGVPVSEKGTVWDLVLPIVALIILSILGMAFAGGYWDGVGFTEALGDGASTGLAIGVFSSLIIAAIMYLPRRLMNIKTFMDGVMRGIKAMIPAIMILVLAWSLSGCCQDLIGTAEFVSTVVGSSGFPLFVLPAIIFVIAAFLSFSMGTSWGTFGILLPIVVPIFAAQSDALILLAVGATLAGSIYGDHCSPISDTTILASAGGCCDHIKHVSTQLPYASLVAGICLVGYLIAALTVTPWIPLVVCITLLFVSLFFLNKRSARLDMKEAAAENDGSE